VEIWGICSHQPNTFQIEPAVAGDACARAVAEPVIRYRIDPR
jgi:hypothetical protein